MKAPKRILTIVAAVFAVGALVRVLFVGVVPSRCDNIPISESASPDGRLKAVVFTRDCGSVSGLTTQVSILESSSSLLNGPGNAFVADTNHGAISSAPGSGPEVHVRWQTRYHLFIEYPHGARGRLVAGEVAGVQIEDASISHDGV